MEKYSKKNLKNIQTMVQNKSGVVICKNEKRLDYKISRMILLAGCLLCFVMLSAFAYVKFSDFNGDKVGFASAYQGDGKFEIVVMNSSDRELKLQDKIKIIQWSTGEEVNGNPEKIKITNTTIPSHSQGIITVDLSESYDVEAMEENLQEGDWYYFVLTNNHFVFGQNWMCSFHFETEETADVENRLAMISKQSIREQNITEPQYSSSNLIHSDWNWPTVSQTVSALYGKHENGTYSDHINIAGTVGDEIYAVADGVVTETSFENICGNVIVVDLGDGVLVKYGHLKDIEVSKGDEILQGQVIATLGQTGMATGPNLLFMVIIDGEEVNPLNMQ